MGQTDRNGAVGVPVQGYAPKTGVLGDCGGGGALIAGADFYRK